MREVLSAVFDEVNARGGVFGRRIELRPLAPSGLRGRSGAGEDVFALVGGVLDPSDPQMLSRIEEEGIPVVGPWPTEPRTGAKAGRFVFYLFPGLLEQATAIDSFAAGEPPPSPGHTAVLHPDTSAARSLAVALTERRRTSGRGPLIQMSFASGADAPALVRRAKREGVSEVFFLGRGAELTALLQEAARQGWEPRVLGLGTLAGRAALEVPTEFKNRVFLAFPTMPIAPVAASEFLSLLTRSQLTPVHRPAQVLGLRRRPDPPGRPPRGGPPAQP
jgi:ABC-type branched-subunit amino acid transport system substrate-binding protein